VKQARTGTPRTQRAETDKGRHYTEATKKRRRQLPTGDGYLPVMVKMAAMAKRRRMAG